MENYYFGFRVLGNKRVVKGYYRSPILQLEWFLELKGLIFGYLHLQCSYMNHVPARKSQKEWLSAVQGL